MRTAFPRRRAGLIAAVIGLAVVLPLSACGSDNISAANGTPAPPAEVTPIADAGAIWTVLQKLPARDVEVLHASFTPDVRDDLADIVHAAAESARG